MLVNVSTYEQRTPCEELNKDKLESGSKYETGHEKDGKGLEGSNLYKWLQGNGQFHKSKEASFQAAFEAEGSDGTWAEKLNNLSVDIGSNPPGKQGRSFQELLVRAEDGDLAQLVL